MRTKVTISIDASRLDGLDEMSRRHGLSRSRMMERAIDILCQRQVEERLREGYLAMRDEDRKTAEEALPAMREVLE